MSVFFLLSLSQLNIVYSRTKPNIFYIFWNCRVFDLVIMWNASDVSKLKLQGLLQLYFNYFIDFFELEQRGMYDIEKKIDDVFFFFFFKKRKWKCLSFFSSLLHYWLILHSLRKKKLLEEGKTESLIATYAAAWVLLDTCLGW